MVSDNGNVPNFYREVFMKIEAKATSLEKKQADLLVFLLDNKLELSQSADAKLRSLLGKLSQDYQESKIKKEYFSSCPNGDARYILVQHTGPW